VVPVVVEKPFGRDLASARALNHLVGESLHEAQTFRIDHYLGKETVQNILVFRYANAIFEPLWNRKHIDHVEDHGGRNDRASRAAGVSTTRPGSFATSCKTICSRSSPSARWNLQSPSARTTFAMKRCKSCVSPPPPLSGADVDKHVVLAQYCGYRQEPGVAPDSRTPTYAAMKVLIDNWRWQGVPFYLRGGQEARCPGDRSIHPLQPVPALPPSSFDLVPGGQPQRADPAHSARGGHLASFRRQGSRRSSVGRRRAHAHELRRHLRAFTIRSLRAALARLRLRGDATLFARRDEVEGGLEVRDADPTKPGRKSSRMPSVYEAGSAGPKEADRLIAADNRAFTRL